ncbi:AraC family transcriptional regulator [Streptomyces sp. NBC_01198]|uniref:AraC family transcriptional regulator n=1 Tax=Streptomyces sp. NBC_01198 TaxID=2903769 RepID=UPI002E0F1FE4|nr:AraC family transcriptional regulator [Streptomyces sp. NBC_01198]
MEYIVQRAVAVIRDKYGEPLTLDELARMVLVSKFHFLRSFRRTTGVTPGRFLSAVRLAEAKRLLLDTSLKVSDISAQVGYSSIGSFTRRFTESVGLPPTQYRQSATAAPLPRPPQRPGGSRNSVSGYVRPWRTGRTEVFVGLFDSPILQGRPAVSAVLQAPGPFRLTGIPAGTWYLHAATLPEPGAAGCRTRQWRQPVQLVDCTGPLTIRDQDPVSAERHDRIILTPRPAEWFRPPVLLALPHQMPGVGTTRELHSGYREPSATAV